MLHCYAEMAKNKGFLGYLLFSVVGQAGRWGRAEGGPLVGMGHPPAS